MNGTNCRSTDTKRLSYFLLRSLALQCSNLTNLNLSQFNERMELTSSCCSMFNCISHILSVRRPTQMTWINTTPFPSMPLTTRMSYFML